MEFKKSLIPSEQLPDNYQIDYLNTLAEQIQSNESLTKSELCEKLELLLVERTKSIDENNKKLNPKKVIENRFILAQFYFDSVIYKIIIIIKLIILSREDTKKPMTYSMPLKLPIILLCFSLE